MTMSLLSLVTTPDATLGMCDLPPPSPPDPASNLALDSVQHELMCAGKKANYVCTASGLNVREVIFCYGKLKLVH